MIMLVTGTLVFILHLKEEVFRQLLIKKAARGELPLLKDAILFTLDLTGQD